MDLTTLFCHIDDLVQARNNQSIQLEQSKPPRGVSAQISLSELMTIIIASHHSADKNFNSDYHYIQNYHCQQFPKLISSHRFIEWMPSGLIPLSAYLKSRRGQITGLSQIDSGPIAVGKNIPIPRNKVFQGLASRGKSSLGWLFGFQLHLIVNQVGQLLAFKVTTGNVNDRTAVKN